MKFQIGDNIIIKRTKEEGIIQHILPNSMAIVLVKGSELSVNEKDIDFPYFDWFTTPNEARTPPINQPVVQEQPIEDQGNKGLWLILLPIFYTNELDEEQVQMFKIYLQNETTQSYKLHYRFGLKKENKFELETTIGKRSNFYLHNLEFENLNDTPCFSFTIPPRTTTWNNQPFQLDIKPKPKQILQQTTTLKNSTEETVRFLIFKTLQPTPVADNFIHIPVPNKTTVRKQSSIAQTASPVVDLHIEKIVPEWNNLSNLEILTLQLKHFEHWYAKALEQNLHTGTVIHGIGKGTLRNEVHSLLNSKKEIAYFVHQYSPRYGYGATEIFFK